MKNAMTLIFDSRNNNVIKNVCFTQRKLWCVTSNLQCMAGCECSIYSKRPGMRIIMRALKSQIWLDTLRLQWRYNGRDGVSNQQPYHWLSNRFIRRRSKKTTKLCVTGLWMGNSPLTGEFPAPMASNAENVSIWWRHHASHFYLSSITHRYPLSALPTLLWGEPTGHWWIPLQRTCTAEFWCFLWYQPQHFWTNYRVTRDFKHGCAHVTSVQWNMNVISNTPSNLKILEYEKTAPPEREHRCIPWWRHQMETFSALLALCVGPVTRSFDVFFDLRLNKRLSKQS